ncbi:MAG TPA: uroporphyrinogen-III C-methyltransferase [Noviherbaspirillum sp.]
MEKQGKVVLVGAGPGDPELLTLKAVKAIASADVILVDDLVHPDVLDHARFDARIVHVGKRGGCESTPQEFIDRLLVAEAHAGHCVVRLKGGDPFIFGRGGEECAHLRAAGIAVEVVNGISSGLAAPASIGVPLTHRNYCPGVVLVTGHGKNAESNPDWATLAKLDLTLVIYMGMARVREIQSALCAGGKSAATPVAVIQAATTSSQRHIITTLGDLPAALAASAIASPGIIVVGEIVRCASRELFDGMLKEIAPPTQQAG